MNIKIINCLSNVEEMKEKIQEASKLESEISKEENRYNSTMQREFKYLKHDIAFLNENIISTFPYIKVESDEDVEAMKGIIEFVKTAKFCSLSENQKADITKALFSLGKGKHARELQEYSENLSKDDVEYLDGVVDSPEIVISSLHNAFNTGKSNPVVDRVFGQYYNLIKFVAANIEEGDYGKALMKKIVKDPEVLKEHKDMIKKAYQDIKAEMKYSGLNLGGRIASGTTFALSVPFFVTTLAEMIGTGIIKKTGDAVKIVTEVLALPFDLLAMKIQEKSDSTAAKVGAVIVDLPGILLKGAGAITNGILKVGAAVIDIAYNLALMPVNFAMLGILKLGKVGIKDRIKICDKNIAKNISRILSENGEKISHKNVTIENIEIGEDGNITIVGDYFDKKQIKEYRLSFEAGEDIVSHIRANAEKQEEINKSLMAIELIGRLSGEAATTEQVNEIEDLRLKLVYQEAGILANITTQKPIKKTTKEAEFDDEDEFVENQDNEDNDENHDNEQDDENEDSTIK